MVFCKMNKERLIEEVRKYNLLYDLSDAKYSDTSKKDEAWKEISKTLAVSVSTCKKTWSNLREAHRRAIKKKSAKSGQAAVPERKWQYEYAMNFLLPHYKERATVSSLLRDSDQESTGNDESQLSVPDVQSDASITEDRPQSASKFSYSKRPRRHVEDGLCESSLLMKYILEGKETNKDEIDLFFSGIATTVKKFSDYNKAMIKSQIFNLVSQMELREINEKQNNCYDSNSTAAGHSGYTTTTNYGSQKNTTQPIKQEFDSTQESFDTEKDIPEF